MIYGRFALLQHAALPERQQKGGASPMSNVSKARTFRYFYDAMSIFLSHIILRTRVHTCGGK